MLMRLTLAGILLTVAAPLAGQEAGLLLGFSHAGEYRTMWITMSADSATVAAEVADLVLSHSSRSLPAAPCLASSPPK